LDTDQKGEPNADQNAAIRAPWLSHAAGRAWYGNPKVKSDTISTFVGASKFFS
jgi:hypothetical protein